MHTLEAPQLARSNSASSISSTDTNASVEAAGGIDTNDNAARRTRRRFSNVQLMMLEHLYHQTSHPTREQRDAVAKEGDMETRSVTIWFQNKRQTERRGRATLNNSTNRSSTFSSSLFSETFGKTIHTVQLADRALKRSASSVEPSTGSSHLRESCSPTAECVRSHMKHLRRPHCAVRHPSLDHIATRRERPHPRPPQTPLRHAPPILRTPPRPRASTLWENMPSSPMAPSPDPKEDHMLLDFGRGRLKRMRTLEWACAAARIGGQDAKSEAEGESEDTMLPDLGGDTEDEGEVHEAVTPKGSQTSNVVRVVRRWTSDVQGDKENTQIRVAESGGLQSGMAKVRNVLKENDIKTRHMHDEDMMNAALALCGLGRLQ